MTKTQGSRPEGLGTMRNVAFVVHLTDVTSESNDQAHGRVEHVHSGRATRFDSVDELMRFMRQTLAAIGSEG